MPDPNKFNGLLAQMGIMSPTEKAQANYQNQLSQLSQSMALRAQNLRAGEMGASFGFPAYMMEQAFHGGGKNQTFNIPDLPQQESTVGQEAIVGQQMQAGNQLDSKGLEELAIQMQGMDPNRASGLQMMALQMRQQEEEAAQKQAQLMKPTTMGTVGVAGNPAGRQEQYSQYNPDTKQYDIKNQGPAYEIGKQGDTNIDLGSVYTGTQQGKATGDFAKFNENTLNFLSSALPVHELLGKGAASGYTGDILTSIDNALATAKTSMTMLLDNPSRANEIVTAEFANKSKWKDVLQKTNLSQSALTGLAYTLAASYNQDGRISDKDLDNAFRELGGKLSNPESARTVLKAAILRNRDRYKNAYESIPDAVVKKNITGMYNKTLSNFDAFEKATKEDGKPSTGLTDAEKAELEALRKQFAGKK